MPDNALTIQISADTGAAATSIGDLETRLSALEKAYMGTTTATTAHAASTAKSTIETRVAAEAATGLGGALDALATHYRVVTAGSEALGIETSGLAAKLAAFGEVVEGLEASFAPLIVALVAFEAAMKVFDFLKDGVVEAAALQTQMTQLRIAFSNSNEDWDVAKERIDSFVKSQGELGFAYDKLRGSLSVVAAAGHDTSDAFQIVAVAENVAKARGMDLEEVTHRIISAEAGRATSLLQLDPRLKDFIKDHHDMASILEKLAQDMSGQATGAANDYQTAVVNLNNAWSDFKEDVGTWLVPWITSVINAFRDLVDQMHIVVMAIAHTQQTTTQFEKVQTDKFHATLKGAHPLTMGSSREPSKDDVSRLAALNKENDKFWEQIVHPDVKAHADRNEQLYLANQRQKHLLQGIHLHRNPDIGKPHRGGGGGSVPGPGIPDQFENEVPASVLKNLDPLVALHDKLAASEESIRHAMEMSSTAIEFNAKALELKNIKAKDAVIYEKALNDSVVSGTAAQIRDTAAVNSTHAAYEAARNKLNAYNEKIPEGTKLSLAQKEEQKNLTAAVHETAKAHEAAIKALDHVNTTLNTHIGELNRARVAVQKLADETNEAAAKIQRSWNDFFAKEQSDMARDLAVSQMTNAQKYQYYKQMVDSINATDATSLALKEGYLRDEDAAYKASLQDQINAQKKAAEEMRAAYKKYIDDATKQTASFISDIILKHKSLKDEMKSVFDQIAKSYIDMVAKMVVQSSLFKSIFPFQGAGSTGGIFGGLVGGGKSGATPDGTAGSPIHVTTTDAGGNFLAKMTGSTTGVSSASLAAAINSGGYSGPDMSNASFSGGSSWGANATGGGSALGNLLGGALTGAALGSTGASLTGGNGLGGSIGGGLGGLLGIALHANPLISAGLDLVGGVVGGLFGPHETAAQQPDLNNSAWGQNLADWQGGGVTVGNNFVTPGAKYNNSNGGSSESIQIANWVKENQSNLSSLTQAQQGIYQQMLALMGGNANAGAGAIGIKSEHQGMVTLTDGQTMSVDAFNSLVSNFKSTVGGTSSSIPTFNISRPYPNANTSTASQNGSIPSTGIASTPTINITVNGSIVGTNGMSELATTVSQTMYGQQRGIEPISSGGGIFKRNGSGF